MSFAIVRALSQAAPRSAVSTAAQVSVGVAAGQILAADANRKGLLITNTGTTTLYLVLGSGTPTTTVYHVVLRPCTAANDGQGGAYIDDSWVGAVQAVGSGAGGTLVILEFTEAQTQ